MVVSTIEELFANIYVQSFFLFAVFVIVAHLGYLFVTTHLKRIASRTKTQLDDMIVSKITLPATVGIFFYGAKLGLDHMNLAYETLTLRLVDSAVLIIATYIVKQLIDILIDTWIKPKTKETESTFDDSVLPLIHRFTTIVVILLGLVFVLNRWSVNVGPLITGLGIAGIAIAFALQSTLGNVLSGISLVLDKNFQVGDVIDLEQGKSGTVVDIGFRSTKILTGDSEMLVVPNAQLAAMSFRNYMLPDMRLRVTFPVSVAYGSDPDKVKKIILDQLAHVKNAKILKDPIPYVLFVEMGEYSIKFNLYFWVESPRERVFVKDELNTLIYNALRKAKIQIPFPTRIIYMKKEA